MNPKDLKLYTFIDGDLYMDVYVSLEQRNVYMKQTEIAKLLDIDKRIVSKFILNKTDSQMGQVANLETKVVFLSQGVSKYYGLQIIKEIGQKYKPERIKKIEDWLEEIIIEKTQEVVDDNFKIIRYNQDNLDMPVRYDWDTNLPWMTQKEISNLYGTTISAVNQHIKNIFLDEELDKKSVIKNYLNTGIDGKTYEVMLYNYDMILAIGYRTRTSKAVNFRNWVSEIVKNYQKMVYTSTMESDDYHVLKETSNYLLKKNQEQDDRLENIEKRLDNLDPNQLLFSRKDSFLAYLRIVDFIATANKEVFIIDPYADRFTLALLVMVRDNIKVIIVTNNKNRITEEQKDILIKSHSNLQIEVVEERNEHDRFIFIDRSEGLIVGQSANTLGNSNVNIIKTHDKSFVKNKIAEYIKD